MPNTALEINRLEEAKKHVLFHHNPQNTDGYITLAKKDTKS